jgi:hypothetical protein
VTKLRADEVALLSRRNARQYVGGLGEETFDRAVAPHCTARVIGNRRYYRRADLDAWVNGGQMPAHVDLSELIRRRYRGSASPDQ